MNDKQLAALFMSQLLPAIQATSGLASVKLKRNFQPRQQGRDGDPCVYFFKLGDKRYGHTGRRDKYNEAGQVMEHTESQQYLTTYQFSAWVPQDPKDVTGLTESDILNIVSGIMQSDAILSAFRAAGAGVSRVTDVRNPYIVDEHDQFEAVPTFDVVLSHRRQSVSAIPAVETVELKLGRV